jgi:hypothetical protein
MDAPQEIVAEFGWGRLFESRHPATGGVHAVDDMADDAILAAGIETLQHNEE